MIAWLSNFFKQRRLRDLAIDPSSKCPACGARRGSLKCKLVETKEKPNVTMMVEHTCQVCEAKWYEPTIVKPEAWIAPELLRSTSLRTGW